jgi:Hemerythrin HHE cation binding domain
MTDRENLFRPIHKGIRLMIYQLGSQLQTANFADIAEGNRAVAQVKHDLGNPLATCILCMLRVHSHHEEKDLFSEVSAHDPDVVEMMLRAHAELAEATRGVAKTGDEVLALTDPARRVEVGGRLLQEANELFARYLTHLNVEESMLVPVMWQWFTDEQLRAMRARFYDSMPLANFETWMRWTLPALNEEELVVLFSGLKNDPKATDRFDQWVRLAHMTLDLGRWLALRERVGLQLSAGT